MKIHPNLNTPISVSEHIPSATAREETQRLSRVVLDLLKELIPLLQKLNTCARESRTAATNQVQKHSGSEVLNLRQKSIIHLINLAKLNPNLPEYAKTITDVLEKSSLSIADSSSVQVQAARRTEEQSVSDYSQNEQTLTSCMEKLMEMARQIQQLDKMGS